MLYERGLIDVPNVDSAKPNKLKGSHDPIAALFEPTRLRDI